VTTTLTPMSNAQHALHAAVSRSLYGPEQARRDSPDVILAAADLFLLWLNEQDAAEPHRLAGGRPTWAASTTSGSNRTGVQDS